MKRFITLIMLILLFIGCSFFQKKDKVIISSEQLSNAILVDDNYLLNKYLSSGFPIDYENHGETLLRIALENNSLKSIKTLLDRGIDVNAIDIHTGMTPIFYVRSLEALKLLLNDGADVNITNNDGISVFNYFLKNKPLSYCYLIIEHHPNYTSWDTLLEAVISGTPELIKKMADSGADFTQKDDKGNFPIYYSYNRENILQLLAISNYDLQARNKNGENILGEVYLRSVANNFPDVVNKLLSIGVDPNYMSYGDNALSIAKNSNNIGMLELLYKKGIK